MADYEIECNECGWRGLKSALDRQADKDGDGNTLMFCPDCGASDFESIAQKKEEQSS